MLKPHIILIYCVYRFSQHLCIFSTNNFSDRIQFNLDTNYSLYNTVLMSLIKVKIFKLNKTIFKIFYIILIFRQEKIINKFHKSIEYNL